MAKIDDSLVQRFKKRSKIHDLLKQFVEQKCPLEELQKLKKQIKLKDQITTQLLLDIMMEEEGEVSNLALLLLSECATPKVAQSAERLLNSPKLSDIHRSRLAAFLLLHQESRQIFMKSKETSQFLEKFLYFLDAFWQQIDPLDVGRIWLEDYNKLRAREKISILKALFSTGSACYLPIYSIELGSPHVSLSRFVADQLSNVDHENTLLMLQSFPELKDTATRIAIEHSIKVLKKKRRNGELELRSQKKLPAFYRAFVAEEESAGFLSVIFAKKLPEDHIRFSFTLIDRWDQGILSCYGDLAEDLKSFNQIVEMLNEQSGLIHYYKVNRDYAVWILRNAEALSIERGYSLHPEYLLCRCLLWDESPSKKDYGLLFGMECCECGAPIRMNKSQGNAWMLGDIALCSQCIKKKKTCEHCGRPIIPEKAYALARADMDHITLICESCYKDTQNPNE